MNTIVFPSDKGTNILSLQLVTAPNLTLGKLGTFNFSAGWYAYVGSAFGSSGLHGWVTIAQNPMQYQLIEFLTWRNVL